MNLFHYPYISAEDPDSFARFTIEKRLPSILDNIISSELFAENINGKLLALKEQLPSLKIHLLSLDEEELSYWNMFFDSYSQKNMLETPFFFAEMYFYRRLLEITQYSNNGIDPFEWIKANEIRSNASFLEKLLTSMHTVEQAILVALSGNKADLSQLKRNENDLEIIVDHSEELLEQIDQQDTIHIILDNAGVELFCDLLLAWQILQKHPQKVIKLYPKKLPLLVSDATLEDINILIEFLKNSKSTMLNDFGRKISILLQTGNMEIILDSFWNSPNHFTHLPKGITSNIQTNDLVIAKGDANYRRFYEDRAVPSSFKGAAVISANQFALRTLKSEIVAGVDADLANQLSKNDAQWLVNGKYAVIQRVV